MNFIAESFDIGSEEHFWNTYLAVKDSSADQDKIKFALHKVQIFFVREAGKKTKKSRKNANVQTPEMIKFI